MNLYYLKIKKMNRRLFFIGFVFFFVTLACNSDDDSLSDNSFLNGRLTSVTNQQLEGRWAIFQIEFENRITDVPESSIECGRDFFDFQTDSEFREYVFDDNFECTPKIDMLSWTLSNGVVTFSDETGTDKWVITELSSDRLVFKLRFDADEDGDTEVFKAICYRYEPPVEMDIYSKTFFWNMLVDNRDKILLKWDGYKGYNEFEKYEIYRLGQDCDITNTELISTITDMNETSFIDENPPSLEQICYVFKIYTNKGLLGESDPITVDTSLIEVPSVNLSQPTLNNSVVDLVWESYQGYYFSHYEIEVRNYSSGFGGAYQEEQLAIINDIDNTNTSVVLPYVNNPVFVINVYNIFGTRNQTVIEGQNQQSTTFTRKEILPVNSIRFAAFSPNEPVLYFTDYSDLYMYNYNTNSVETSVAINSSSIVFVKVFESSYGTEVIINTGGGQLQVYDSNLNYKYNLIYAEPIADNLVVTESGYWLAADRQNLYSFSRTDSSLTLISTNNLYNQFFSTSLINIIDLGQNKILAGNHTQPQGLIIGIDSNGNLSDAVPVNLNSTSRSNNGSLFSKDEQYVLNIEDKTLYSTITNNLVTTLHQNFFPSGISTDGLYILGTNNNPKNEIDSFHERKVRTLSYPTFNEKIYNSQGYPIIVHQNHLGQLISVSKGMIGSLSLSPPEKDIFIEIIE